MMVSAECKNKCIHDSEFKHNRVEHNGDEFNQK